MGPKIEGTPDFIWRGWSKDFFEFEIFDSGITFIRKILIHVGIFFAYSKQSEVVILHKVSDETEDVLGCLECC